MPHVRVAVSEALHIAKMLAPGNNTTHTSFGMAASPVRRSADHSDWSFSFHENVPISPVSKRGTSPRAPMSPDRVVPQSPTPKRGASSRVPIIPNKGIMSSPRTASSGSVAGSPTSQESRHLSYSPVLTSSDFAQVPSPTRSQGRSKVQRTPLYPTRGMAHAHPPRSVASSPSSSVTTVEECESPSRRCENCVPPLLRCDLYPTSFSACFLVYLSVMCAPFIEWSARVSWFAMALYLGIVCWYFCSVMLGEHWVVVVCLFNF